MKQILRIGLSAVLAGICIGLGGLAFLNVDNKIAGAFFFVIGLFTICTQGFHLYTGKVCYVWENDASYGLQTILIWLGNFIGCMLTAALFSATRLAVPVAEKAQTIVEAKISGSLLSVFILGILCNLCIYIAVEGFRSNGHEIGKYLSLLLGVMVFILCGFEHCIANMFYFSIAHMLSLKTLAFLFVNTLGNAVGGWIFPLCKRITEKTSIPF